MEDPSIPFDATITEFAAIRQDLESGRVAVTDLPRVLERAAQLVDEGRDVLRRGYEAVEMVEREVRRAGEPSGAPHGSVGTERRMSNTVTVVGNLTRDPELRYTPSGAPVAKFGVAVNRTYTNRAGEKVEETSFFNVNAGRQLAENVAESLVTGTRVLVTGLQSRSWESEDGQKHSVVEIEADEVGPSLRWATGTVTKTTRSGAGDWNSTPGTADRAAAAR